MSCQLPSFKSSCSPEETRPTVGTAIFWLSVSSGVHHRNWMSLKCARESYDELQLLHDNYHDDDGGDDENDKDDDDDDKDDDEWWRRWWWWWWWWWWLIIWWSWNIFEDEWEFYSHGHAMLELSSRHSIEANFLRSRFESEFIIQICKRNSTSWVSDKILLVSTTKTFFSRDRSGVISEINGTGSQTDHIWWSLVLWSNFSIASSVDHQASLKIQAETRCSIQNMAFLCKQQTLYS